MKTVDENLWTNNANLVYGYMTKDNFEKSLAEHDEEIIGMIDNMTANYRKQIETNLFCNKEKIMIRIGTLLTLKKKILGL